MYLQKSSNCSPYQDHVDSSRHLGDIFEDNKYANSHLPLKSHFWSNKHQAICSFLARNASKTFSKVDLCQFLVTITKKPSVKRN